MFATVEEDKALANFELKLAWAERQFQVFEDQIAAWRASGGYAVVFEPQGDGPRHTIRMKADETPAVLSLVLGDALFAMRSGLDHLAYSLAEAHTRELQPDIAEKIEFPIFGDRPMRGDERERKVGALHPDAVAVIEGLQPNNRGDDFASDPLWALHDLARIDRHRLLHLTVAQLNGFGVGGDNVHIEEMSITHIGDRAVDGAKLGWCSVRPINPGLPMHMKVSPQPEVIFKEGSAAGRSVLQVLREIHGHINEKVLPGLRGLLA